MASWCRDPRCAGSGRRHGPRKDRRWATSWSPEQISNRLRIDFPHNESMRISHEAIYQALYVQGRGALKRELVACPANRASVASPQSPHPAAGQEVRQSRDHDQPTSGRGRRPGSARTLGRRPDPRTAEVPRSGPLLSARRGSRCCCIFPACQDTANSNGSTTGPLLPVMAPKQSATRSLSRSPPYPNSCAAPWPGTKEPRWPNTLNSE